MTFLPGSAHIVVQLKETPGVSLCPGNTWWVGVRRASFSPSTHHAPVTPNPLGHLNDHLCVRISSIRGPRMKAVCGQVGLSVAVRTVAHVALHSRGCTEPFTYMNIVKFSQPYEEVLF